MKPNLNTFILIAGFIAVIWFLKYCGNGANTLTEVVKTEIVYRDTGTHTIEKVPVFYPAPGKPEIPANLDTPTAITEHFTPTPFEIHYRDSSVEINHVGTLFENRIKTSDLSYKNLRPTQLITHVRPDPTRKLAVGLAAGHFKAPFLAGTLRYTDRRGRSYWGGHGTGEMIMGGVDFTISFRKR